MNDDNTDIYSHFMYYISVKSMSDNPIIVRLIVAKIVLILSLYICLLIPSPLNKFIVSGITFALWGIIIALLYFSYKQATQGRPLWEFRKNFIPNQSIIIVIFFTIVFGSFSILTFMGFTAGIWLPLLDDFTYSLEEAKIISIMATAALLFTNILVSYFGFRRYHRNQQLCG